ncbi:MAG: hypothetical protein EOO61_18380 [Hymenobacter sp.]|nr:MAG: hypothetical protein EOO61_18380 [Hymenobacter sp.]
MAWLAAPDSHLLPYIQASPAQLSQAIISAREALGPYYPSLDWSHWHQAFKALQPALKLEAGQASMTPDGLSELARYLETVTSPAQPDSTDAPISDTKLPLLKGESHLKSKNTYSIRAEVVESLNRVSFWRRKNKSALVTLALTQFLSQYPESRIPIPPSQSQP